MPPDTAAELASVSRHVSHQICCPRLVPGFVARRLFPLTHWRLQALVQSQAKDSQPSPEITKLAELRTDVSVIPTVTGNQLVSSLPPLPSVFEVFLAPSGVKFQEGLVAYLSATPEGLTFLWRWRCRL